LLVALTLLGPSGTAPSPIALHDKLAGQWARHMRVDGRWVDPYTGIVAPGYGTVMIAAALVETAARSDDPALDGRALRAATAVTRRDPRFAGVFEQWATARIYTLLRAERLPGSDGVLPPLARHIEEFSSPYVDPHGGECYRSPACYSNHEMVEAAADRRLLATGLTSPRAGAKLHDRAALARHVDGFLAGVPAAFVAGHTERGQEGGLLSDTNAWPLAYHGLSTMFLAELVDSDSPAPLRATLARARDGICLAAGPDGDLSYNGARQGQAWVSAVAFSALGSAGPCPDVRAALWRRLNAYGFGRIGLNSTMRFRDGASDYYALDGDVVTTNALVLSALSLAAESDGDQRSISLGVRRSYPSWYSLDRPGWGVARSSNVWMAVRRRARYPRSPSARMDLRYDAGVVALKYRDGAHWIDLLRPRPRTVDGGTPAGPMLLGAEPQLPDGTLTYRNGAVILDGRFTGRSGTRGRHVRIVYRMTADGMRASMRVRRGERIRLGFFLAHGRYRATVGRVEAPTSTVSVTPAARFAAQGGYASCCDRHLDDVSTTVAFDRPGRLEWSVTAGASLPGPSL
jgi:hypothetical protein